MKNASHANHATNTHRASRPPRARKLAWAVAVALAFGADCALADLPTGGTVVQGSATIMTPSMNGTLVNVTSNKAVINWNSFSISNGNVVQFAQPSSTAVTLNRVTGGTSSDISGNLLANGQIFLVNPNGVFFSATANINVGGLIASTLDITDNNFMAGTYVFNKGSGSPFGQVVNNGTITTASGGFAALFGEQVVNGATGVITSPSGKVGLGVGEKITVSFDSNQLLTFTVDQKALASNAYATNNGQLIADGGSVQMSAGVANALAGAVVNQNGVIRAAGVSMKNGDVYLSADGGDVDVAGSIDVGGLSGAPASSLRLAAVNGNVTVHDGASLTASGAAGTSLNVQASGQVSLGGTLSAQSSEAGASIAVSGNGVALNTANLSAGGYMSSFITVNSGSGAITQAAGGQVSAATTATASQAATAGGYAFGGVTLDGAGSHNLAGSISAGATGPDGYAMATVNSTSGSLSVGNISARADQGGTGASVALTAPGSITTTGTVASYADAGPASANIAAGGAVNLGSNVSVQGLSGTSSATLATISASSGNLTMAPGTQVSVTDLSGAGVPSNGAGLALTASNGRVIAADLASTSASGATQVAVTGSGGVALNGNVSASGQSALVNISASGTEISLAGGKTVQAVSTVAGGGGALVNLSTPGGSLRIDGTLQSQAPGADGAQVVTNPSLYPAAPGTTSTPVLLSLDPGQALLSRLLAASRTTPVNPLASTGLIVMPNWNIVGASLITGGNIDAAVFEEDGPDSLNPTSDIQVDAAPINAAMKK